MTNRRDLVLTGLTLAGVAAGWQWWIGRPEPIDFVPLDGLPGWRLVETGPVTAPGASTFLTIGQGTPNIAPLSPDALWSTLYRVAGDPPIAVFSDFFCPYCRVLLSRLASRSDLPITWHELPLLGTPSEFAARAAVAADLQDGYPAFVTALASRGFRPSPQHMASVAADVGLDGQRLVRDMDGPEVARRLDASARAASTLGIYGTPGMTVGRTLVSGNVSIETVDDLVLLERG